MSKFLEQSEIENRLGAIMNAYKEENGNNVFNLNCVASLLEKGAYTITSNVRGDSVDVSESVAKSIRRLTSFVNRISDIAHKGSESFDLDSQIEANINFWKRLSEVLNNE